MADFNCTQCGLCCRWPGYVHLTSEDIDQLAGRLNSSLETVTEEYTDLAPNRKGLVLKASSHQACIFLQNNRCSVYDARPRQCRQFPFSWGSELECPALNQS